MKIETTIKYYEGYIPPKCRKTRFKEITETILLNLREVDVNALKLAFKDLSHEIEGYYYKGKIYSKVKHYIGNESDNECETILSNLIWWRKISSIYFARCKSYMFNKNYDDYSNYETREEIIARAKKDMQRYILVNGELYEKTELPCYRIITFGLGHNHGGTGLLVCYNKKPQTWIKRKENRGYCFSALDFNNAYQKAVAVANGRGDNLSIQYFKQYIIVYMQELFL